MPREYTNAQLERMVLGEEQNPNVVFYEQSKMNVDLSNAAGKRIYTTVLMVKYTQPGVTDWAPARAQKEDIKNNPVEYQRFLDTRDDVGSPSVSIIPGISPDEAQELIDYGIVTITKLCQAEKLPEHLQHVQASAVRLNEVLKHERKVNEEIPLKTIQNTGGSEEVLYVPATDRPVNPVDVGQRGLSPGVGNGQGGPSEGIHQGGRHNSGQGHRSSEEEVKEEGSEEVIPVPKHTVPGCNWDISFDSR